MIIRIIFILMLYIVNGFSVFSQDFDQYIPLASQGQIPEEFISLSQSKFNQEKQELDKKQQRNIRKTKENFLLLSNYYIDNVLRSGILLFNDPVSLYVKKVADVLLQNDPELRSKLRFYIVRTPVVNSFCTNNGIVFVNMGLIAQLENEAQLAYILSHEFIHYKKNHVINSYIENNMIFQGRGEYGDLSYDQKKIAGSKYSKELESEADIEGLKQYYMKSNYNMETVNRVFDVLLYSYLPFDEVEFNKSFFEKEHFKFPDEYQLKEISPITAVEDYDDSGSDHPNIKKRREDIARIIATEDQSGKPDFIVSEEEFYKIRKICRYELSYLYLLYKQYDAAIYNSYLLQMENHSSKYLRVNIGYALYGLSKYKNNYSYHSVHEGYKEIEGQSQSLYHFFSKISVKELNVLALSYLWKLHRDYPSDGFIKSLADDIFKDLVFINELKPEDFFKSLPSPEIQKTDSVAKEERPLSKYDKIKKSRKAEKDSLSISYALIDFFSDNDFKTMFDELMEEKNKKDKEAEAEKNMTYKEQQAKIKKEAREKRKKNKKGETLDIDKIVLFNPSYIKINETKKDEVRYIASEKSQEELIDIYQKIGASLNLQTEVMDINRFTLNETDKYNDYSLISKWLYEKSSHEENEVILSNTDEIKKIVKKYGTRYFAFTGINYIKEKRSMMGLILCMYCVSIYGIPFGIYYLANPEQTTHYFFYLYDIETGRLVFNKSYSIRSKDSKDIVHSYTYHILSQIINK